MLITFVLLKCFTNICFVMLSVWRFTSYLWFCRMLLRYLNLSEISYGELDYQSTKTINYKLRSLEILAQNRVISFVHLGCVYSSKCCNASEHVTHVCACALTLLRLLGYERYTSATRQHALCNVIMILLLKEKGVNTWIHFLRLNLFA